MFYALPATWVLVIYVLAAVLPAAFLLRFIYRADEREKEPPRLIGRLLLAGVGAALAAMVLERVGMALLNAFVPQNSAAYVLALAFLVVAVVEEGAKLFFLRRRTWLEPNFNYRFDGVVYAVAVSLGFAAFENIGYVFNYGLSVAVPRALMSIPGHMGFAVFMGAYYGRAKLCEGWGDIAGARRNTLKGYLIAVVLHGLYDTCAMLGTTWATVALLAFVAVMYVVVYRRVRREAADDEPV